MRARTNALMGIAGLLAVSMFGCTNAVGWAPGEAKYEKSTVPTPVGTFQFEGERDTEFVAQLEGNDGVHIPNGTITLTRNASGPLATRGTQQIAIEDQRQRYIERQFDRIDRRLDQLMTMAQPFVDQSLAERRTKFENPPASQPSKADQLRSLLADPEIRALLELLRQGSGPASGGGAGGGS